MKNQSMCEIDTSNQYFALFVKSLISSAIVLRLALIIDCQPNLAWNCAESTLLN